MTEKSSSRSVLIVDDEPLLGSSLIQFLGERGFTVTSFTDSVLAREAMTATAFDSVILDINMPHVNGVELASVARVKNPGVTVIFVTGMIEDDELSERLAGFAGATVLQKPFDLLELLRLLRSV